MTDPTKALIDYLSNIGAESDVDFLRQSIRILSQVVMELEVEQQIGAAKHERKKGRSTYQINLLVPFHLTMYRYDSGVK